MEISVARALKELKTLDNRINTKIYGSNFIAGVKKSSKKVNSIYSREEFEEVVKSNFDSITDLISRRKAIKTAIVESNAKTEVLIAGVIYKVADAIERKNSISIDRAFLNTLDNQYKQVTAQVQRENDRVENNLNSLINSSLSSDSNKKDMAMTGFAEAYRSDNCYEIIDCLRLKEKIDIMRDEILAFETEVDSCLSESNAITKIVIPD